MDERGRRVAGAALVALAVAGLLIAGQRAAGAVPRFAGWVEGLGAWGPAVFVAGYVVATVALVPGSLLSLGAGALFGLARGALVVLLGATLGASAAFLVARYVARGPVERRLAGDPRLAAIDRAVGERGRRIVFLLRLSPVFPFNLLNYALGLTRVRFVDFLVASAGMLPGIVLYVYYGKVVGDVTRLAGGAPMGRGAGYWTVLAVGLVATIAVTAMVTRIARRALDEATGGDRGDR
ncbi:MAG TPA: TVP38/TMEM64 family protein [Gemmatimonadales bacterium]|nr:TVP38/TMEM64 family protein [Gemmatimonadales bacterium]